MPDRLIVCETQAFDDRRVGRTDSEAETPRSELVDDVRLGREHVWVPRIRLHDGRSEPQRGRFRGECTEQRNAVLWTTIGHPCRAEAEAFDLLRPGDGFLDAPDGQGGIDTNADSPRDGAHCALTHSTRW